jgi:hypothetical protein
LAHEDKVEDDQSAQFYFNDIAHVNDALSNVVEVGPEDCTQLLRPLLASAPVTRVPVGPPSGWLLHGKQTVAKFKEAEHNIVQVHVAVLRLPTVDTDMVLHYNQPLAIHANSSSATTAYAAPAGSAEEGAHFVRAMLQSLEGGRPHQCPPARSSVPHPRCRTELRKCSRCEWIPKLCSNGDERARSAQLGSLHARGGGRGRGYDAPAWKLH